MVRLLIKRGDEVQFLFDAQTSEMIDDIIPCLAAIFNGRLKVERIISELGELSKHGISLPPDMVGLTEEQWEDLKLTDKQADVCVPSGGYEFCADPIGRRNGRAPKEKLQQMLAKTAEEAKALISKNQALANVPVTEKMVGEAISLLKGAVMIAYPMGLPAYDPVRMELENREDLAGQQSLKQVLDPDLTQLWFSGKQMQRGSALADFVGTNEKSKVTVKLQKKGQGAPAREPLMTEQQQKHLMAAQFRRQEELKRLDNDLDDTHLSSNWADSSALKRQLNGLTNVSWNPR